ncbi:hypothetical protein FH972_025205 [Carpinus fangiana]|uniref:Uncharacterized protein n=1 Tax=Carpinus fangiana TaxID=176857 RepID=A0A5N6L0C5_9ROSI|nr:hypothetical protein FH972_025205 [Carpinus fangiana]
MNSFWALALPSMSCWKVSSLSTRVVVNVPALLLAGLVLEREGEDGAGLLDRVGLLRLVGRQGRVDQVEGLGGGEVGCARGLAGRLVTVGALYVASFDASEEGVREGQWPEGSRGRLTVLERHDGVRDGDCWLLRGWVLFESEKKKKIV